MGYKERENGRLRKGGHRSRPTGRKWTPASGFKNRSFLSVSLIAGGLLFLSFSLSFLLILHALNLNPLVFISYSLSYYCVIVLFSYADVCHWPVFAVPVGRDMNIPIILKIV